MSCSKPDIPVAGGRSRPHRRRSRYRRSGARRGQIAPRPQRCAVLSRGGRRRAQAAQVCSDRRPLRDDPCSRALDAVRRRGRDVLLPQLRWCRPSLRRVRMDSAAMSASSRRSAFSVHAACIRGVEAHPVTVRFPCRMGFPALLSSVWLGRPFSRRASVSGAPCARQVQLPRQSITVNLAPADMRKTGSGLDLPHSRRDLGDFCADTRGRP